MAMSEETIAAPAVNPALQQFIKFCIIGASSTVIDVFISQRLTYGLGWHWIISKVISFSFAVTNGFIWNSLWTFKGLGSSKKHEHYVKFVTVNLIGLGLNLAIMKPVFLVFTGRLINQGNPDKFHWAVATGTAILLVAIWNFLANKKWTFKHEPEEAS